MPDLRTTRFAKSGDEVNIAYQILGEGPPDLLMFSGAVLSIDSVDEEPALARFHDRLASFCRVIRFDLRGIGLSDPVTASNPPSLEQWMQDALAVMDAAGAERAAVFAARGPSLEGLLLAATHPERVSALVIVNGQARAAHAPDYPAGIPQETLDVFLQTNTEPDAVGRGYDILQVVAPSAAADDAFRDWWNRSGNRAASPATAKAILDVILRADVRQALPLIRVPTLILHRRDDRFIPSRHGRYLATHIDGAKYVELAGADDLYWLGDTAPMLDEIGEFLTGIRPAPEATRALATILFTDIVGSTTRVAELGDHRWRELLRSHNDVVRRQLRQFRGREVKHTGDGFVAVFDGPARAVRCACAVRNALRDIGIEVRAGVHAGEVEVVDGDLAGMAVHIGARVSALAGSGEVLVSESVPPLVVGSGIDFTDRDEHELKGVPGTWRLYAVAG